MAEGMRQFVSFELDRRLYGLPICAVKEVNPNTQVTPVPRSPQHIRGLVNIRGQVVLVIDTAVIFGWPRRPITESSHILILKTAQEVQRIRNLDGGMRAERFSDKPVGFLADRIGDVVTVDAAALEPPPPHLPESIVRYVEGVVRLGDGLLVVLNAPELLWASCP
ncbi:MAG: hypothetical protein A3K19_22180 [Lentisphaerae bacterium RIFOXYB12_FULL_65_16]|nr:MAG: hypothetical protein A3K18_21390 [Lentisphaerae bacterium RIFOXYA12_64_32]OGV93570.1 MAG: hypothetical protein A3K19_22180 [Lentisphaerae bacterium RIFOXYB12_FULL_65_16]